MQQPVYSLPDDRGIVAVSGDDRFSFLQGLVTNDVRSVGPERAVYAALLTPQGKYLHDFFVAAIGDTLYLDCEAARREDLRRRLSVYRLRAKVALADATADFAVAAVLGSGMASRFGLSDGPSSAKPWEGGIVYVDPRLADLGIRAILPRATIAEALDRLGLARAGARDFDRLRLTLGIPDGSRDLPIEKAILIENGFDELHGIDWEKGCYMGQELTARTKYRGLVRKRLLPVSIDGPVPAAGSPIMLGDKVAGEMRSGAEGRGLALLRLESLDGLQAGALTCGDSRLTPHKPAWAKF
jgi:folate-binding protein YgfZ